MSRGLTVYVLTVHKFFCVTTTCRNSMRRLNYLHSTCIEDSCIKNNSTVRTVSVWYTSSSSLYTYKLPIPRAAFVRLCICTYNISLGGKRDEN